MRLRQSALPLAGAGLTLYVLAICATPVGTAAFHSPTLRLVVACVVAALFALAAVASVVWAEQRRDTTSVLIAGALISVAVDEWCFGVLPAALRDSRVYSEVVWGRVAAMLVFAGALALAAYLPTRAVDRVRAAKLALATPVIAAVAATVAVGMIRGRVGIAGDGAHPVVTAGAALLVAQVVAAVLFFAAAIGLVRKARRLELPMLRRLADVVVLLAAARLAYFRVPSLYVEWVSIGDVVRLAAVIALGTCLVLELARQGRAAAVARERERIAREIHGGVAQELSLLVMRLGSAGDESDDVAVARRALASSRQVIRELRTG